MLTDKLRAGLWSKGPVTPVLSVGNTGQLGDVGFTGYMSAASILQEDPGRHQ